MDMPLLGLLKLSEILPFRFGQSSHEATAVLGDRTDTTCIIPEIRRNRSVYRVSGTSTVTSLR